MALGPLKRRLAGGVRPTEDAVMVLAPDAATLLRAGSVIDTLTGGGWRLTVLLIVPDASASLAERFRGAELRMPHLPLNRLSFAALAAMRVRSALVLNPDRLQGKYAALSFGAKRRGVPVFSCDAAGVDRLAAGSGAADLAAKLAAAIGVERDPAFSPDRLAARLSGPMTQRILFPWLKRLETVDALNARLGHPQTILCLGNGPSGRNPVLAGLGHDALFRVNSDWRSDGLLERPDMVFAGVKRAMRKMGRTLIGVASERKANALIACRGLEPWHGPAEFAVVERIAAPILPEVPGALRPTTGAYMLAAAIALRPQRLIVAGMDMFRHPDGAYAGGARETNAYTPSHSFETDSEFLRHSLGHFTGQLVSYSTAFSELAREADGGFNLEDAAGG